MTTPVQCGLCVAALGKKASLQELMRRTITRYVRLDLHDEAPDLGAPLGVLKAQCKVDAGWLSPDDKRVLLALVDIGRADSGREDDALEVVLGACNECGLARRFVIVAGAERGALVCPALTYQLVHLVDRSKGMG